MVVSSPLREHIISADVAPVFQTPPITNNMLESIARFYERFVVRASHPLIETPLSIVSTLLC